MKFLKALCNKRIINKTESEIWTSISSFQMEKAWKRLNLENKSSRKLEIFKYNKRIYDPKINVFVKMYTKNYKKGF